MAEQQENPPRNGQADMIHLTTELVCAFVANNAVPAAELQGLLQATFATLSSLAGATERGNTDQQPAVPIRKSITEDYLVCLEDGKQLRMLKRYLRTHYDMSPEEYRRKWGLPGDYPMVAPSFARRRSDVAKETGLGSQTSTAPARKTLRKRAPRKKAAVSS